MKVLVVGAGPAGLSTAFALSERGVDVTVLERSATIGGRVRTLRSGGYALELGPAGILDDAPDTQALLRRLGEAAPRTITASAAVSRRWILRGGRLRALPTGLGSLLFGDALSLGERVALLREPFVPRASVPDETVAAFARRRFGDSLARGLAQPMVVGVFGGDYEHLELVSAFPKVAALEQDHGGVLRGLRAEASARRRAGQARARLTTFAGGMGALPTALGARLGERVRLGAEVVGLERSQGRTRVRLQDGELLEADRIVLAGAPDEALPLLAPLDAALSELLRAIPMSAIASVSLAWRREELAHALDGFGLLVPMGEGRKTIGVLFMTSIFPDAAQAPAGEVLLRVMLGGPNDPGLHALDDESILRFARDEVGALLGATTPPRFAHLQRWPRAIPQYVVGHAARALEIEARLATLDAHLVGTSLHGVGVNDVLRDAARLVDRLVPA